MLKPTSMWMGGACAKRCEQGVGLGCAQSTGTSCGAPKLLRVRMAEYLGIECGLLHESSRNPRPWTLKPSSRAAAWRTQQG